MESLNMLTSVEKDYKVKLKSQENNLEVLLKDVEEKIKHKGNPTLIFKDKDRILNNLVNKVLKENGYKIVILKSSEEEKLSDERINIFKSLFNYKFLMDKKDGNKLAIFFECDDINNICKEMIEIYYMLVENREICKEIIFYMNTINIPPVGFENNKIHEIVFDNDIE